MAQELRQLEVISVVESAVCPFDEGRYGSPEMLDAFSRAGRYRTFLAVEAALAQTQGELGLIPPEAAQAITEAADAGLPSMQRIDEIEVETRHEVAAVIRAFGERCGDAGRFVHFGATSSDILDSALALQLARALPILEAKLCDLLAAFLDLARTHRDTPMVGRTHGQHALPITFGFRAAGWAQELAGHVERLRQLSPRLLVGKMAGAVGSFAGLGPQGPRLQRGVMERLGLGVPVITTQIVSRDRHAELVFWSALTAATLEGVATDVRNLQRPEIAELHEPFGQRAQIGSSTMPHKRNPVVAENICGLARLARSLVQPALETVPSWHERDLTNSSVERFTMPQTCLLLDEILDKSLRLVSGLGVDAQRMRANLEQSEGRILAEAVMLALIGHGMSRQEAYFELRGASQESAERGTSLLQELRRRPAVGQLLSAEELERLVDENAYAGRCRELVDHVVEHCSQLLARTSELPLAAQTEGDR